jgi:heme A synthase
MAEIVLLGITCVLSLIGTLSIFLSLLLGLQSFLLFAAYLTVILILLIPQSVRDYFNSLKKAM